MKLTGVYEQDCCPLCGDMSRPSGDEREQEELVGVQREPGDEERVRLS